METNLNKFFIFQIDRNCMNLAKQCLFLLEEQRDYSLKLEKLIKELNIGGFTDTADNYQKARKRILTVSNDSIRELTKLTENVDINLKEETNFNK